MYKYVYLQTFVKIPSKIFVAGVVHNNINLEYVFRNKYVCE